MARGLVVAAFAAVVLGGCSTTPVEQLSYSQSKELALQLHQRCAEQGYPQGHPEFNACMQQEVTREAYTRHANQQRQRRAGRAIAGGMAAMGNSMQRSAAVNRPTYCTSRLSGTWVGRPNTVNTRCN